MIDPLFPNDADETRYWVFNSAKLTEEHATIKEDGVEAESSIRPEDALELGSDGGVLALPPNPGMKDEQAKAFHAALQGWPKGKARTGAAAAPGGAPATAVTPKSPAETVRALVLTSDKDIAFLAKFGRICARDPDAAFLVGQAKTHLGKLEELSGQMRGAEQEVAKDEKTQISEQFSQWATASSQPTMSWIAKNKAIINNYISQQNPKTKKSKEDKEKEKAQSPKD